MFSGTMTVLLYCSILNQAAPRWGVEGVVDQQHGHGGRDDGRLLAVPEDVVADGVGTGCNRRRCCRAGPLSGLLMEMDRPEPKAHMLQFQARAWVVSLKLRVWGRAVLGQRQAEGAGGDGRQVARRWDGRRVDRDGDLRWQIGASMHVSLCRRLR